MKRLHGGTVTGTSVFSIRMRTTKRDAGNGNLASVFIQCYILNVLYAIYFKLL